MFSAQTERAIVEHARACYPRESCGLVVDGVYVPLENIADRPKQSFAIDAAELLRDGVQAVVHSHPDGPRWPSAHDMRQQIATGLTWGIVPLDVQRIAPILWWGPGVPVPPLVGRMWRHGPSGSDGCGDCYAVIRDWYLVERGIALPEFPRDNEWDQHGGNLYLENFAAAGFAEIAVDEAREGDVVLARIGAPVPNHGGVVLSGGRILHHLRDRLSSDTDLLGRWRRFVTHALRYQGPARA